MTRINLIPPKLLQDSHLLAEYREISRVVSLAKKRCAESHKMNDIPDAFTLGTGHVKFFLNKLTFIRHRMRALKAEIEWRGFKAIEYDFPQGTFFFCDVASRFHKEWTANDSDEAISKSRIEENIRKQKGKIRWYGIELSTAEYIEKVLNNTQHKSNTIRI